MGTKLKISATATSRSSGSGSGSRSSKGFKVKHAIQLILLLGFGIWLVYEIHRSYYDGKANTFGQVDTNISEKLQILKLGRKHLPNLEEKTREDEDSKLEGGYGGRPEEEADHKGDFGDADQGIKVETESMDKENEAREEEREVTTLVESVEANNTEVNGAQEKENGRKDAEESKEIENEESLQSKPKNEGHGMETEKTEPKEKDAQLKNSTSSENANDSSTTEENAKKTAKATEHKTQTKGISNANVDNAVPDAVQRESIEEKNDATLTVESGEDMVANTTAFTDETYASQKDAADMAAKEEDNNLQEVTSEKLQKTEIAISKESSDANDNLYSKTEDVNSAQGGASTADGHMAYSDTSGHQETNGGEDPKTNSLTSSSLRRNQNTESNNHGQADFSHKEQKEESFNILKSNQTKEELSNTSDRENEKNQRQEVESLNSSDLLGPRKEPSNENENVMQHEQAKSVNKESEDQRDDSPNTINDTDPEHYGETIATQDVKDQTNSGTPSNTDNKDAVAK